MEFCQSCRTFIVKPIDVPDDSRKLIPSMTQLLQRSEVESLIDWFGPELIRAKLQHAIERLRRRLSEGVWIASKQDAENLITAWLVNDMDRTVLNAPRKVINATGILLHTGLGRAPLGTAARNAILDAAGSCLLEVDPESSERSYRGFQVEDVLRSLTGCQDSLIVNNNAGATLLVLQGLCQGREVLISRSQLVEIGGSFRLPEIFKTAGVILREVGTTNRTHLNDYATAITERTAAILRVHASNFRIIGFTAEPSSHELAQLARARGVLMFDDIGSGQLFQNSLLKAFSEPDFRTSVEDGADLVLGSGDKLLGGPQAGIVVGRASLIEVLRKHPLARCLRIDKLCLAALHATLLIHARGTIAEELPVFQMLNSNISSLAERAESIAGQLNELKNISAEIVQSVAEMGGGSCAGNPIPSVAIRLRCGKFSAQVLARKLRMGVPGIWSRIDSDAVLLDLRSVLPHDDAELPKAIESVVNREI